MDGLQAAWDHHHHDQSTSSLLWSNFPANNNKLIIMDHHHHHHHHHLAGSVEDHGEDYFFLNPIPHFINNSNTHKGQDVAGNASSSLVMASSPAAAGGYVDRSYSKSVDDGSMESLDCLLTSASNSNTATTATPTSDADDDSISLIFSSAANFWNTAATATPPPPPPPPLPAAVTTTTTAISSSGDSSENYNKTMTHQANGRAAGSKRKSTGMATTRGNKTTNQHVPLNPPPSKGGKKPKFSYTSATKTSSSDNNISFQQYSDSSCQLAGTSGHEEPDQEAIAQMKEMIYRAAAFRPVNIGAEEVAAAATERPKRKNVRISTDPQTVAARQRRERISERIRVLQRLVPGGNKMDTASMLDEAANYLKFLRSQVKALENVGGVNNKISISAASPSSSSLSTLQSCFPLMVPTNLTFSSSSSFPTTTTNYGHQNGNHGGMVIPMQAQNNFPSLVLQNPSTSNNLLYHQYHPHHQV